MSDPNYPPPPGGGAPPPPPPPGGGAPPPPPPPGGGAPPPPPPPGGGYPPAAPPPPGGGGFGGGYNQPPAQPYGGGNEVPRLDVGAAVSYGWKKFQENVGPFILLVLAVFVALIVLNIVQAVLTPNSSGFLTVIWTILLSVVVFIVSFIVQAGVYRAGLGVTRGEEPKIAMLTDTTNIVPFILTVVVVGLGAFVGFILCILPGIAWLIFTAYAPILALDKGVGPGEAISTSIGWVKDNFGQVFLLLLVAWVIYVAGAIVCLVGLLVSIPVALVAIIYSYRALNQEPVVP